jgi:hypothetical protein
MQTIKELLGVSEEDLESYVKSSFRLGINPIRALQHRFPDIYFFLSTNAYVLNIRDNDNVGKPYILIVNDRHNKIIGVGVRKFIAEKDLEE